MKCTDHRLNAKKIWWIQKLNIYLNHTYVKTVIACPKCDDKRSQRAVPQIALFLFKPMIAFPPNYNRFLF